MMSYCAEWVLLDDLALWFVKILADRLQSGTTALEPMSGSPAWGVKCP